MPEIVCDVPTPEFAARVASSLLGSPASGARRFTTGSRHFVFEVFFEERDSVVIRASTDAGRDALSDNARLTRLLRPMGVPLARLIAEELDGPVPYLVLERLPGSDLGLVIGSLCERALETVAAKVAAAQRITAATPTMGRYGYAAEPSLAPYATWAEVLDANLARSRARIRAAQVFKMDVVETVAELISQCRAELNELPALPFLHDTTTKNVIVTEEGRLSGIVDVDELCFGDPRYVIALTEASLIAFGGSRHYTTHRLKIANQPDDRIFRLYVSLFLVDFMSEHGEIFNGNQRPFSAETQHKLVREFYSSLREGRHSSDQQGWSAACPPD
jgi:aminoglycoside phosphotransferase